MQRIDAARVAENFGGASGHIEINGNKLFYEILGAGPLLILLHDGLMDSSAFDVQFSVFAKEFTVFRYDRPGYGKSLVPVETYSNVNDLHELITRVNVDQAYIVGGSAGGGLALDYALLHGGRVAKMVLVGPGLSGYEYSMHMYARGPGVPNYPETLAGRFDLWINDPWFVAPSNEGARGRMREILTEHRHNLAFNEIEEQPIVDAYPRLNEITTPTLLLVGADDIADNHAVAGILSYALPNVQKELIVESGHVPYLEVPEEFNERVLDFLK